jgi:hypothetical protein
MHLKFKDIDINSVSMLLWGRYEDLEGNKRKILQHERLP